jgi:membrane protease YdiL (CAAX protease family)
VSEAGAPPAVVDRGTTIAALLTTIAVLAVFNVTRHVLSSGAQFPLNVAMAGVVLALARWPHLSASELGLSRADLGRGVRYGAVAAAIVLTVLLVAAIVPATRGAFDDSRADVGAGRMLVEVLISVPLGTVLLEELAFRGSLLGLLRRLGSTTRAVIVSSVLFGLWHIAPALSTAGDNSSLPGTSSSGGGLAVAVVGTAVATTVAGLVFCWLRLRSGSLVAPMLAHIATNSGAFFVAWVLAR